MTGLLRASLALAAGLAVSAGDDDYVRLLLEKPAPTPYRVVRYEVSRRARATTAVQRRQIPGYDEPLHAMSLMTREEADGLWRLVEETGALSLSDAPSPAGAGRFPGFAWKVELLIDGTTHAFRVADPENQPDRRYAALVSHVRSAVEKVAGELPFRNVFLPKGQFGWLNVLSVPSSTVAIDGFDTKLETPVYGYELSSGKHRISLRSVDGLYERTYEVRVEPSGTTHLHVDIR